jgi:hypothetical protein
VPNARGMPGAREVARSLTEIVVLSSCHFLAATAGDVVFVIAPMTVETADKTGLL